MENEGSETIVAHRKKNKDGTFAETVQAAVLRVQRENPGATVVPDSDTDAKSVIADEKAAPPKADAVMDRKLQGADASTVPEVKLEQVSTIPIAPPNEDKPPSIASFNSQIKILEFKINKKDSFPNYIDYGLTPMRGKFFFKWLKKIDSFNDRISFYPALAKLAKSYYEDTNYMLEDMGDVLSDFASNVGRSRHTPPEKVGFNAFKLINAVKRTEDAQFVSSLLSLASDGAVENIRKNKFALMDAFTRALVTMQQERLESRFGPLPQLFAFLRSFEDSTFMVERHPALDIDPRWTAAIKPVENRGISDELVASNPNLMLFWGKLVVSMVESLISVSAFSETQTIITYLQEYQAQPNRITEANTIPGKLSANQGRAFFRQLCSVGAMPKAVVIVYHPRLDDKSLSAFIDAVYLKMCPSVAFDSVSQVHIHNHIAKYLPLMLPLPEWEFNGQMAEQQHVDFLIVNYRNRNYPERFGRMWPFLLNWGTAGKDTNVAEQRLPHADYGAPPGLLFTPFTSEWDERPDHLQAGEQFENLIAFKNVLALTGLKSGRTLHETLSVACAQQRRFSDYSHFIHATLRRIGRTGLFEASLSSEMDNVSRANCFQLDYKPGSAFSMFALLRFDKVHTDVVDIPRLIQYRHSIEEWLEEFTTYYYFVEDHFPKPYWKRMDHLKMVESLVTKDIGFNSLIFGTFRDKPFIYEMIPPARSNINHRMMNILVYAKDFIMANPEIHGFAHRFFYMGGGLDQVRTPVHERVYLANASHVDRVLTAGDLEDLTRDNKITALFDEAQEQGLVLQIEHPVIIRTVVGRTRVDEIPPIQPQIYAGAYKVNPITIYATYDDEFIDDVSSKMFLKQRIRFGVERHELLAEDITFLQDLVTSYPVFREGHRVVSPGDFKVVLTERFDDRAPNV
jgi:hypothetical protein